MWSTAKTKGTKVPLIRKKKCGVEGNAIHEKYRENHRKTIFASKKHNS